jgi:predicted homoserine dehydrogenase-like protein
VVGAGYVGANVVAELARIPAVTPSVIAARSTETAVAAFVRAGVSRDHVLVSDEVGVLTAAIEAGRPAVCSCADIFPELPIALVVEATGALEYGAASIVSFLDAGMDVISYNAEVDALLARTFHQHAERTGSVYTIADGDQPGVLLREIEAAQAMGFEVTAAINCKRYMDVHQTPSSGASYTARDNTSALMTTAFGDGTKMQVEMAVVANATGLRPVRRGMVGVETVVERAADDIRAQVNAVGVVDYTLGGDFAAGVGVMVRHPQPELVEKSMRLYKMGDGPDYFLFRPYHLVHLELWKTIADVVLDRRSLSYVGGPHVVEVVAVAKRSLRAGERLDAMGGSTVYGQIDDVDGSAGYLPVGLSEFATLRHDVAIDEAIALSDVDLDDRPIVRLWRDRASLAV